ncbi:hypothetical protein FM037_11745 [Shewanella psychropiezotolerans]|uniref:Lipoprotein n=1 Tax=Shewanella psychropiezotolerans TaxID=2593655 RepID=A0ABX5X1G6_9GAMM|nr:MULTISPECIES: hypothetical protein [Shewanella]MPY26548.1 hypothetical protein [Shewanella sp. YLB-07]QDO83788.1 hypothetical protein FM037_11745 [Shewanella psychropiezotolerans]
MRKVIVASLVASLVSVSGCTIINMAKAGGLMMDYNLLAVGDAIYNAKDGNQYLVPPAQSSNTEKMLVCYQTSGLFSDTDEQPLRLVADEILKIKNSYAGEGKNRSGVWESRTCYEFTIQHDEQTLQPIGAYLDESTGKVVIVGENNTN